MIARVVPTVLQAIVGAGLLNVWLLRRGDATPYRGGASRSLREEFAAYGLPPVMFYLVGTLKVLAGIILLAGFWLPLPVTIATSIVALLMIGALAMHMRVKDSPRKSVPAAVVLAMCLALLVLHRA